MVAVAEAVERGEQAVGLAVGEPGAGVDDAQFDVAGVGPGAQCDRASVAVAECVVDDVGDNSFEQAGLGEDLG